MSARIPAGIRAVFFDAVGTLIHPDPPAGEAYARVGRRFGSRLEIAEVRRRFGSAFAEEEARDAGEGQRASEAREEQRWRAIVARVLDDVTDREACFQSLYQHFARPSSWRVEAGSADVVRELQRSGVTVGVASNFDRRLIDVIAGLSDFPTPQHLLISSAVGWKKPAPEFFRRLCGKANLSPSKILFIGDDVANDYEGARAFGLRALLFDPDGRSPLPPLDRVRSLGELLAAS